MAEPEITPPHESVPPPEPAVPMPGFLGRTRTWAVILAFMLIPFFVKIPKSLNRHAIISPLGDKLHIVLLAGVTLMLYWRGPLRGRLWWAAGVAALIGGAIEFLQLLVGRMALLHDFVLDLLGIALVVAYVGWKGHGYRWALVAFIVMLATIPAQLYDIPGSYMASRRSQQSFPLIADFAAGGDHWIWGSTNDGEIEFPEIEDSPDGPGRVVRLAGEPPSHWPGGQMKRFSHDWEGYTHLKLDVRVVEAATDTVRFAVRLDDYKGYKDKTYISSNFCATSEWRTISMPFLNRQVRHGDRIFDHRDVNKILIFLPRPDERVVIEIDNLRVE